MNTPYTELHDALRELERLERMVVSQRVKAQALEVALHEWVENPLPLGKGPLEPEWRDARESLGLATAAQTPLTFLPNTTRGRSELQLDNTVNP